MRDHAGAEDARAVDDAAEIDGHHALPVFQRAEKRAAGLDPGIVHEDVDLAEPLDDLFLQGFECFQLGNVRRAGENALCALRGNL